VLKNVLTTIHIWLPISSGIIVGVYTFIDFISKAFSTGNPGAYGAAFIAAPFYGLGVGIVAYITGILILLITRQISFKKFTKFFIFVFVFIFLVFLLIMLLNLGIYLNII